MPTSTTNDSPTALHPAFVARVRERLSAGPSDHLFDVRIEGSRPIVELERDERYLAELGGRTSYRPAAVLVPIVLREEPVVLLTKRTQDLPNHAGQIAFPGGKMEAGDADAVDAALREAEEEIGLERRHVHPLGYLDSMRTHTGFHIYPIVAAVTPHFALTLDQREVADAFEVPLDFLMDQANHQRHSRMRDGVERFYYAMPFGERYIWGITAAILRNLSLRLGG